MTGLEGKYVVRMKRELDKLYDDFVNVVGKRLSQDFLEYIKTESEKRNWYEKLCAFSGNLIRIKISDEKEKDLYAKLNFSNLNVEPYTVYSTFVFGLIATVIAMFLSAGLFFILSAGITFGKILPYLLLESMVGFAFSYYLLTYPNSYSKKVRVGASSELVLAVLYIAIGLRNTPNLENAVTFAAVNLPGAVGKDLRKILWDVHTRRYSSVEEALQDFGDKWKVQNEEFTRSLDMLTTSLLEPVNRDKTIDNAVKLILESNLERMKEYSRELKAPITTIHALGILLPVITLILFPIVTLVLGKTAKIYVLVGLYDLILPFLVLWLMKNQLEKRPYGFYVPDIYNHPQAAKPGNAAIFIGKNKIEIPLVPIAAMFFLLVSSFGLVTLFNPSEGITLDDKLFASLGIFWGLIIAIVFYTFFSSNKNKKIKEEIEGVERDFGDAMFILGTVLRSGQPLENSLKKVTEKVKNEKIHVFFEKLLYRISQMGLTLKEAVFNKDVGLINEYPSALIKNTMRITVESTTKGMGIAATTLIAVSDYLKGIQTVSQNLKDILEDVISSMKIMSIVLVPLAAGAVVGLGGILVRILIYISDLFKSFPIEDVKNLPLSIENIMPLEIFVIVVGIYMIEVLISLSVFSVRIEKGDDNIEIQYSIATSLMRGALIFTATVLIIFFVLGRLISDIGV